MIVVKKPLAYAGTVDAMNIKASQRSAIVYYGGEVLPNAHRIGSDMCFNTFVLVIWSGKASPRSC